MSSSLGSMPSGSDKLEENSNAEGVLVKNSDNEYTLDNQYDSCWITIGNISVYLRKDSNGVSAVLYPVGAEQSECIASTYAYAVDAQSVIEEEKENLG